MYRIAVTGHRSHRISAEVSLTLSELVQSVLLDFKTTAKSPIDVLSALAEGADRIVAEAALKLSIPYSAILPFADQDYEQDFASDESKERFRFLLAHAQQIESFDFQRNEAASAGYHAVGLSLVNSADIMLAIWDGESARGKGGTAEVVAHALDQGVPVIWLRPQVDTDVKLLVRTSMKTEVLSAWREVVMKSLAAKEELMGNAHGKR